MSPQPGTLNQANPTMQQATGWTVECGFGSLWLMNKAVYLNSHLKKIKKEPEIKIKLEDLNKLNFKLGSLKA